MVNLLSKQLSENYAQEFLPYIQTKCPHSFLNSYLIMPIERSIMNKMITYLSSIFLLLIVANFSTPTFQPKVIAQTSYDEAYEKTKTEFNSIKTSSEKAEEYLNIADNGLKTIEKRLDEILSTKKTNPGLNEVKKKVLESREAIKKYSGPLKTFNEYAKTVTNVTESYEELEEIKYNFNQYRNNQGELAGNLYAISKAMETFGENVPLIGKAIESYGQITGGLIQKINTVSKEIDENRNQGAISGQGFYKTGANLEKYNVLKTKYPSLAANTRYIPSKKPSYVYEPYAGSGPYLIWDEESKDFYAVDQTIPLHKIFNMNMMVRERPTPFQMKVLCEGWERIGQVRSQSAYSILNLLKYLKSNAFTSFAQTNSMYGGLLTKYLETPELFEAYYMFDPYFREGINKSLITLYETLNKDTKTRDIALKVKLTAQNSGIFIASENTPPKISNNPPPKQNNNKPSRMNWGTPNNQNTVLPPKQPVNNFVNTQPSQPAVPKEIPESQYICQTYMSALKNEINKQIDADRKTWLVVKSGYVYDNGYCVGSHEIHQSYKDFNDGNKIKEQTVMTYYSPQLPAKESVSMIREKYASKYPNLKWR